MTAFRQRVTAKTGRGTIPTARFGATPVSLGATPVAFAAADLTDQQVRDMLGAAVSAYLKADGCYGYIKDVNRAQGFVTFTCWEMGEGGEELYKADFTLSDDYQVTLGTPQEVVQTARYEPKAEEMSMFSLLPATSATSGPRASFGVSTFSRREDAASGCAIYDNALLFRAGYYPDKQFSMTPGELAQAAASWSPVGGNIQHSDFLAGRAGVISRAWIDPTDPSVLRGEVRVPLSLDRLLTQGEKGISMEWNRAGKFADGFALVTNPRVSDAALMSLEAQLSPPAPGNLQLGGERKKTMVTLSSIIAFFRGQQGVQDDLSAAPPATAPGGAPVATMAPAPATTLFGYGLTDPVSHVQPSAPSLPGQSAVPFGQPADLQQQLLVERNLRLKAEAANFATAVIGAHRALPAERASLEAQYFQAATDDLAVPAQVAFSYAGQPRTGSRVDALKAAMASRPTHALTQDLWTAPEPTAPTTEPAAFGQPATAQPGSAAPAIFSVTPGGTAPAKPVTIDPAKACRMAAGGQ